MGLIDNLKSYFNKKAKGEETGPAPEGVCPNCWGKQEWEGEFYKINRGHDGNYDDDTYNNFIQNVSRNLDKIVSKDNEYECETCKVKYKHDH